MPFYVTWGERDHARVIEQGRAFVAELDAFPRRARWDEVPGATHFTVNEDMGRRDSRWVRRVRSIITAKESS